MTLKKFPYGCEYILLIAVYFILGLYYPSLSNQYFPIYPYSLSLSRRQLWQCQFSCHCCCYLEVIAESYVVLILQGLVLVTVIVLKL